jgi:DNA polymerase III sliding clamp (beta) subunit (PCNA family)
VSFEGGFNVDYLISALSELGGDRVTFAPERGDLASSPCLITSDDDSLRIVQMPMRV